MALTCGGLTGEWERSQLIGGRGAWPAAMFIYLGFILLQMPAGNLKNKTSRPKIRLAYGPVERPLQRPREHVSQS
jgi:hypothetical protein